MAILWVLLGVISGACIAVQAPINAKLGGDLGLPFAATLVSFGAGLVMIGLITFAVAGLNNIAINWSAPPVWMFVAGGALGAVYVTSSIVLTPQIGAAAVMALAVAGQLLAGIFVDRIGFMGMAVREISIGRIAGAVLLIAGALMIRLL